MNDEIPEPGGEKDLLGDPIGQRDELIGAPAFEINEENQTLVATLRAVGWSQERIAKQLGCDPKTLRKHFSRQLDEAGDLLEAQALAAVGRAMLGGNMSAARKMLDLVDKGRAAVPLPPLGDAAPDDVPVEKPLGKKALQLLNAESPTDEWGDLLKDTLPN